MVQEHKKIFFLSLVGFPFVSFHWIKKSDLDFFNLYISTKGSIGATKSGMSGDPLGCSVHPPLRAYGPRKEGLGEIEKLKKCIHIY